MSPLFRWNTKHVYMLAFIIFPLKSFHYIPRNNSPADAWPNMYASAEYTGANGLARKQVIWDYLIATPAHAHVAFSGRTDESGKERPPPYEGNA